MRVNLTSDEWTTVEVPAGTLQNLSPTASIEIVEENESDNNSGLVLYPRQKFAYSNNVTIKARSVWDTNVDSTQDVILAIEPIVSATGGGGGGGGGGMTTIAIGSTTTGAPGTNATVTNSGTALSAILNFTIPRGATGADGRSFTISGLYPTYTDMVVANPNPVQGEAHFVGTADDNVIYFWDTAQDPPNWTNAGPLKGLKGDPGENGAAATVRIGSVTIGTPVSVTNSGTANAAVLDIVLPPGTASDWFYLRRNNATYVAGDIAYSLLLPSWLRLECVQGGTTGATEPTYTATPGSYANDGTVIWIVTAVNDGTPVGRVVFDEILRAGYIKANGATVADASTAIPRLLAFVQANPSLLAADAAEYAASVGLYLYDSGIDALTLPNYGVIDEPIGTVIDFMGTTAPTDYVSCDGTIYNIDSQYANLAEHINTQFGSYNFFGGNGTTTFAVPDLRGEFLRGTGTNSHTNQGSGANVGEHQDGTTSFGYITDGSTGAVNIISNTSGQLFKADVDSAFKRGSGDIKWTVVSGSLTNTGSTYDTTTSRPTNTSVLYCIKYRNQTSKFIPQIRY